MNRTFDVCIIGGGPAGISAAKAAVTQGLSAVIIENGSLGGTCLNEGCIPTKLMGITSKLLESTKNGLFYGIEAIENVKLSWEKFQQKTGHFISKLNRGVDYNLEQLGVKRICGKASFISNTKIGVTLDLEEKIEIEAKYIIIATGLKCDLPEEFPKSNKIMLPAQVFELNKLPKSAIILGGGVVGCEFASMLNGLGVNCRIVEQRDTLIANLPHFCGKMLVAAFLKKGIRCFLNKSITSIKDNGNSIDVAIGDNVLTTDCLIVTGNSYPNIDLLGLTKVGVHTNEKKEIVVDGNFKTSIDNIYAVGDVVIGSQRTAGFASYSGECAVKNICGKCIATQIIPTCVFSSPEVAAVGKVFEGKALVKEGIEIKWIKFYTNAKAQMLGDQDGVLGLFLEKESNQILGAIIVSEYAASLIGEINIAICCKMKLDDFVSLYRTHPTLGEIFCERL